MRGRQLGLRLLKDVTEGGRHTDLDLEYGAVQSKLIRIRSRDCGVS